MMEKFKFSSSKLFYILDQMLDSINNNKDFSGGLKSYHLQYDYLINQLKECAAHDNEVDYFILKFITANNLVHSCISNTRSILVFKNQLDELKDCDRNNMFPGNDYEDQIVVNQKQLSRSKKELTHLLEDLKPRLIKY